MFFVRIALLLALSLSAVAQSLPQAQSLPRRSAYRAVAKRDRYAIVIAAVVLLALGGLLTSATLAGPPGPRAGAIKPTTTLLRVGRLRSRKSVQNITMHSTGRTPPPKVQNTFCLPLVANCTCANEHSVQMGRGRLSRILRMSTPIRRPRLNSIEAINVGIVASFLRAPERRGRANLEGGGNTP